MPVVGRGHSLLFLAVLLTGCEPTSARCARLASAAASADISATEERAFYEEVADSTVRYDIPAGGPAWDALERRIRARRAEELRAQLHRDYPADTTWAGGARAADSVRPSPTPPLRPSEASWYAEHCYNGQARK